MSDRPRLWVAGGRDFTDRQAVKEMLIEYHEWTLITGAARGTDLMAEDIWRSFQRPYIGVPARWAAYGGGAGPIRNHTIGSQWEPERLMTFPGGSGTENARQVARKLGIPIVEIT